MNHCPGRLTSWQASSERHKPLGQWPHPELSGSLLGLRNDARNFKQKIADGYENFPVMVTTKFLNTKTEGLYSVGRLRRRDSVREKRRRTEKESRPNQVQGELWQRRPDAKGPSLGARHTCPACQEVRAVLRQKRIFRQFVKAKPY